VSVTRVGSRDIWALALAARVGEATYFAWMKRGEAGESPYREFREVIRTLHDVARQHGTEYLVLEYLEGETLESPG
jgi:hypothetical protein